MTTAASQCSTKSGTSPAQEWSALSGTRGLSRCCRRSMIFWISSRRWSSGCGAIWCAASNNRGQPTVAPPRRNPTGAGPPLVGQFLGATDIALVTIGRIANNRILEYQADGKKVREWGNKGTAAGEFDLPHASRRIRIHPEWRKLGEQVIRFNQGRLCTSHPYASPANCFDPTVK